MKKLFYTLLLLPFLLLSQENQESLVLQNVMLTVLPGHTQAFEKGLAAHNKKYHAEGPYQALVYSIGSGVNAGKYMWNMGPLPWSAMDGRPTDENGHDADWDTNVVPHLTGEVDVNYWKFETSLSNFSKNFTLNKVLVDVYDLKRFSGEKMEELMKRVHKTMTEKFPDEIFGMYTNEFSSMTNTKDLAFVSFFEKSAWLGQDSTFAQKYSEVHGEGSFATFLKEWGEITHGKYSSEIWAFRKDLSGNTGEIIAATRQ